MNPLDQLKILYGRNSKHSNYQILSDKLALIIGSDQISTRSRYERERLDYILNNLEMDGMDILDIGGNSGFFSFEAIESGATKVHFYEGNKVHSDFVRAASDVLGYTDKVEITNGYYEFDTSDARQYDVVFLLNVLHHLGDDYGSQALSIDAAKEQMVDQLNSMASRVSYLVLQLGFCWKGNRDHGLFENGTKKELIDFISTSVNGVWDIMNIGIPVKRASNIKYIELNILNIIRDDSLGEFLNRPLFILKSK